MPKRRVPLTRKRKAYADAQGGVTFWGHPLEYPHIAEARYAAALHRLVDAMVAESHRELDRVWAAHGPAVTSGMDASLASQSRILMNGMAQRFQAFFDKLAPGLAKRTAEQIAQHSQTTLHASLKEVSGGLSLKTSVIDGRVLEVTKAATAANIALIKSIPQKYFTDLQGAVMRSIQSEQGTKTVLDAVTATGEVAKKRATLIATDQTRKVTTAVNSARLKNLGVRKFEWLHSSGGRTPRPLHLHTLNGQIFDLHNPPVIDDKTGERGLPGQLINCRCRMIPVVDFGGGDK
jgi:SPP1 gp7 family putative phage head morphogenesis protein